MVSKKYLKNVTIGSLIEHKSQITLCEYDPNWENLFSKEAEKIKTALGEDALQIEHVGSTAIPDLCAKPIIDILLVVKNSDEEHTYIKQLEEIGYTLRIREPDWFKHRMLKGINPEVNLHVFSQNCEEAARMILFRDYLKSHPKDRILYEQTKRLLAQKHWNYIQDYADAKTDIIKKILKKFTK